MKAIATEGELQSYCRCDHLSLDHAGAEGDGPCDHSCGCLTFVFNEWWRGDEPLEAVEAAEGQIEYMHARQIGNSWEYAVVKWRYKTPYLALLVRDGMVIKKSC